MVIDADHPPLAIVNARVWTANPRRPWADGLAVRDGRLLVVGSAAEVRKVSAGARVIDAGGALVVPGALGALTADREAAGAGTTLERGGAADFVLLDRPLPDASPDSLGSARVRLAVVGGRVRRDVDDRDAT